VVESIKELVKEIETIKEHVADQAMEHVHANEVILTCGYSSTVLHFLTEVARRHRKFEVVVSEMAPSLEGHAMAQALAKAGIATTVVTDAAIFAVMARVNKVIVGCQAVLANGGITSLTGVHAVAVAAKHYNVPLVVCTGMYKLAPVFPHDQYSFNELRSPADVSKLDPAGGIARR
jgi:translation initiation factor eIF-2B subunit beta